MAFPEVVKYTSEKTTIETTIDCSFWFQNEFFISSILISRTPFSKYIKYTFGKVVSDFKKCLLESSFCKQKYFQNNCSGSFFCLEKDHSRIIFFIAYGIVILEVILQLIKFG